jgi:hypothetical protein
MIFRKPDGTLVEIKRTDYMNDVAYYKAVKKIIS